MKKVLPVVTLLSYLVAVAGCITHMICGVEADLTMIIVFLAYIVGVIVLMSFFTSMMVKKKKAADEEPEDEEEPEEDLLGDGSDESAEESSDDGEGEKNEVIVTVVVENGKDGEDGKDATAEETEEPEVDVASTEDDGDDDDDKNIIVAPMIVAGNDDDGEDDEEDEEDDDDEDDDDDDLLIAGAIVGDGSDDPNAARFARSRYTRTYASKLIQADDELKGYYSAIKNAFMSYKKVTCSVSREHERVRKGRTTLGIIKLRGKTLLLYLALDPKEFENTMYVGEDVSDVAKYADVPFLYRVKGPRKAARAVRLIGMIAEKQGMVPTAEPANEDYVARFPYETTEALIEKGLIIDNVAEAERKAEKARIAAEEAEKAAHKAIEEAIKAKEHATMVSERSERTVDEIEAAEEAKAARQEAAAAEDQ